MVVILLLARYTTYREREKERERERENICVCVYVMAKKSKMNAPSCSPSLPPSLPPSLFPFFGSFLALPPSFLPFFGCVLVYDATQTGKDKTRKGGREGGKDRTYLKKRAVSDGLHRADEVVGHVQRGEEGEVLQLLREGGREGRREGGRDNG